MNIHTPDCWTVVEFGNTNHTIRKIFAGWYGGFAEGESWSLSSGITEAQEYDTHWEFLNHSGSRYVCYKNTKGLSSYMYGIFGNWLAEAKDAGTYTVQDVSAEYV